jgi:ribosomal RNA-processing protein 9
LLFRGPTHSIDALTQLSEENFITAGQDGHLQFWNIQKKKPLTTLKDVHTSRWITALGSVKLSDIAFSGSSDGFLNIYKADLTNLRPSSNNKRTVDISAQSLQRLNKIAAVPIKGFINSISIDSSAKFAIAAIGCEHRLGRWTKENTAKNGLHIINLSKNRRDGEDVDDNSIGKSSSINHIKRSSQK